jgi:hypothetical protein
MSACTEDKQREKAKGRSRYDARFCARDHEVANVFGHEARTRPSERSSCLLTRFLDGHSALLGGNM